jgi:hypothetical protein
VRGKRFSLPAQSLSHNHCGGVGHTPLGCRTEGVKDLHHKKPHQLIHVLPTSLILLVSFPAGMLPETFESRERIGASASQGGTCAAGEVSLNGCALGKNLKTPGRVVPRIASIAYHIPQDPRSRDRPSFPPFNSQTQLRAWQRENHIAAFPDGSCPPPARPLIFVDHERECDAV